mgnify:CR=1 FL=1
MNMAQLQQHALALQAENENLKKNQEAFQNALIDEVKRIEQTPKMWRFLQYGKLLFQLIDTIRAAVEANKKA